MYHTIACTRIVAKITFAVFISMGNNLNPVFAATPLRIMPVGDSITAGYTDNPMWATPFTFGYRDTLYTRLTNAGYNIQYVGTSSEPWNNLYGTPTPPPTGSLDLRTINQDHHRGYGGWNVSAIASQVGGWLNTDNPDVVLLMIGINDIAQGSSGNPAGLENSLNNLVNTIVTTKPNAHLIVAQTTPYASYTDSIVQYNTYIRDTLVPYWAGQGKHVTTVDMYSSLLTNGQIDSSLFSNGINHPGDVAYDRMANAWFQGVQTAVPEPNAMVASGMFVTWMLGRRRGLGERNRT